MDPFFHTGLSISDSLKTVRKSVLIYETIINVPNGAKVKAGIPCVFSENQTRALIQFDMLPFR